MGAGRRRGAPGVQITYGPSHHPMTVVFAADGQVNPARGVRGGGDGNVGSMRIIDAAGEVTRAPSVGQITLPRGSWLSGIELAGGGYGDPLDREPELVCEDVLERYVSLDHARQVYGIEFSGSADDDTLAVDSAATATLRDALRRARAN